MIRFVVAWLVFVLLAGPAGAHSFNSTVEMMRLPGVEVTIVREDCGVVNAYYSPKYKIVVLCNELEAEVGPAFARFVLAHELAHAIIMQKDIAYTGSHEVAADELAAVMLSLHGDQEAVLAASAFFLESGQDEDPWDDHPGDIKRGLTLACIAKGSQGYTAEFCTVSWSRVSRAWMRLLGY